MTDINLLKDTRSTQEGKQGDQKPPREIELSTPDSKVMRHKSLSSQAPESFWSRIFKSKKKDKSKPEVKKGKARNIKDKDPFTDIKTAEPVVMAKLNKPIPKKQDLKAVREPDRLSQPVMAAPVSSPAPVPSKVKSKEPKAKNEEPKIFKKEPDSPVIPPEPKEKSKKSIGFFGRLFKKTKVKKVPEAPALKKVKPEEEPKPKTKFEEIKTPKSPVIIPDKKEKVDKTKDEKKAISPKKTKVKTGFLASLFRKPQVEEPPKPITLKDKERKADKDKPVKQVDLEKKLTEANELSPSDFGVNLMPEELEGDMLLAKKRLVQFGLLALGSVIVCLLVFAGLFLYESSIENKTTNLGQEIGIVEEEISLYREMQKSAINLKQRTDAIRDLMDEHVYWTNFFVKLEEYTAENVYFISFSGDITGGRVSLTARAASFLDVGRQLLVFQEASDFLEEVEISGASISAESTNLGENSTERPVVDFSINLQVIPSVFNKVQKEAD